MTTNNQTDSIRAPQIFAQFSTNEVSALFVIYDNWVSSMMLCCDYDCLEDSELFDYITKSILSRQDFTRQVFKSVLQPSILADLTLSADSMVLCLFDIYYAVSADIDIFLDFVYENDNPELLESNISTYYHGVRALNRLRKLL